MRVCSFKSLDGRLAVLFDGYCALCNGTVRWFMRYDRKDRLRFATLDSLKLTGLIARSGITQQALNAVPNTILVVRDLGGASEEMLVRSDAVLAMLRDLPQPWPVVAAALRLVPKSLRDLGYGLIARWRYRIWGRLKSCPLFTAEEQTRLL